MATNKETIVQPSKSKTLVRTLIDAADAAPKDAWMNIDELDNAFTPEGAAEIGMLTIKTANQTVEDAAIHAL